MPPVAKSNHPARGAGARLRVNNRSRLRIWQGNIEAENLIIDDEGGTKSLATAGVDAEDANEHHLQVVLSVQNLAHTNGKVGERAYIPVPDATALVDDYDALYLPDRWEDPTDYIRYSDLIDDEVVHGLVEGYTYDMDDEDFHWIEKNNAAAKGEGSSGTRATRTKSKGKEPESQNPPRPFPIEESQFELAMGLLEMVCDAQRPTVHADLSSMPTLADFEGELANTLPEEFFAEFFVPEDVPQPESLWLIIRAVYPHWRERRVARAGHRVMPQLNTDETIETDPWVCFRRRENKPVRKLRRADQTPTHVDRLVRLTPSFDTADKIARATLDRERKKNERVGAKSKVFEARRRYLEGRVKHPELCSAEDDQKYLFPKETAPTPSETLPRPRPSQGFEANGKVAEGVRPGEVCEDVRARTLDEYHRRRTDAESWEDQTDVLAQPILHKSAILFRSIRPPGRLTAQRDPTFLRPRLGRGGVQRLDRRMPSSLRDSERLKAFPYTQARSGDTLHKSDHDMDVDSETDDDLYAKYAAPRDEYRVNFFNPWHQPVDDPDMEANNLVVVDDFDAKYSLTRASLISYEDMQTRLTVDLAHIKAAHEYNKEIRARESTVPFFPPIRYDAQPGNAARREAVSTNVPRISGQANGAPVGLGLQLQLQHIPAAGNGQMMQGQMVPSAVMLAQVAQQARAHQNMASQQQAVVQAMSQVGQSHRMSQAGRAPQTSAAANRPQPSSSPTSAHPPQHPMASHLSQTSAASHAMLPNAHAASSTKPASNGANGQHELSPVQMHPNASLAAGDQSQLPIRSATPMRPSPVQLHQIGGMHVQGMQGVPQAGHPGAVAYQRTASTGNVAHASYPVNHVNMVPSMPQYRQQGMASKPAYNGMGTTPGSQMMPPGMQQMPQHYLPPGYTGMNNLNVANMNLQLGNQNLNLKPPPTGRNNRGSGPGRANNGVDIPGQEGGMPQLHLPQGPLPRAPSANGHHHLAASVMQGRISPANVLPYAAYTPQSPLPSTPSPHTSLQPQKSPHDSTRQAPPSPLLHRPHSRAS